MRRLQRPRSPSVRHALCALAPLVSVAGLAVSVACGMVFFRSVPAQEQLQQALAAYDLARQAQTRQQAIWSAEEALRIVWRALPPRTDFTTLILSVSELAAREHVTIPGMTYDLKSVEEGLALKASISFHASGEYAGIRRFIHQLETSSPYIFVESLDVSRSTSGPNTLSAPITFNVRVVTFLRPEGAPSNGGGA